MADTTIKREELLALTADVVSSFVSNNTVAVSDLPALIEQVFRTLSNVNADSRLSADRPQPAVPIKKSVTPDFIICLEDGAKLKMLKRYLKTNFKMTPEQYRERWGLDANYPMVAPNYAKKRSSLARQIGLGRKGKKG